MKTILATIGLIFFLSVAVLVYLFNHADPLTAKTNFFVYIYLAIFGLIFSFFSLTIYWLRLKLNHGSQITKPLLHSIRQSFFVALLLTVFLFLFVLGLLSWREIILLSLVCVFLEFFFQSEKYTTKNSIAKP